MIDDDGHLMRQSKIVGEFQISDMEDGNIFKAVVLQMAVRDD